MLVGLLVRAANNASSLQGWLITVATVIVVLGLGHVGSTAEHLSQECSEAFFNNGRFLG